MKKFSNYSKLLYGLLQRQYIILLNVDLIFSPFCVIFDVLCKHEKAACQNTYFAVVTET